MPDTSPTRGAFCSDAANGGRAAPAGRSVKPALGGPGCPSAPTMRGCLRWLDEAALGAAKAAPTRQGPKGRPIGPSGGPHASRAARKHGPGVEKRRGGVPGGEALEPAPPPRAAVVSAFRRSTPSLARSGGTGDLGTSPAPSGARKRTPIPSEICDMTDPDRDAAMRAALAGIPPLPTDGQVIREAMSRLIPILASDITNHWRKCPWRRCRREQCCMAPQMECVAASRAPLAGYRDDARLARHAPARAVVGHPARARARHEGDGARGAGRERACMSAPPRGAPAFACCSLAPGALSCSPTANPCGGKGT